MRYTISQKPIFKIICPVVESFFFSILGLVDVLAVQNAAARGGGRGGTRNSPARTRTPEISSKSSSKGKKKRLPRGNVSKKR